MWIPCGPPSGPAGSSVGAFASTTRPAYRTPDRRRPRPGRRSSTAADRASTDPRFTSRGVRHSSRSCSRPKGPLKNALPPCVQIPRVRYRPVPQERRRREDHRAQPGPRRIRNHPGGVEEPLPLLHPRRTLVPVRPRHVLDHGGQQRIPPSCPSTAPARRAPLAVRPRCGHEASWELTHSPTVDVLRRPAFLTPGCSRPT